MSHVDSFTTLLILSFLTTADVIVMIKLVFLFTITLRRKTTQKQKGWGNRLSQNYIVDKCL